MLPRSTTAGERSHAVKGRIERGTLGCTEVRARARACQSGTLLAAMWLVMGNRYEVLASGACMPMRLASWRGEQGYGAPRRPDDRRGAGGVTGCGMLLPD